MAAPTAPTGVSATRSGKVINVTWTNHGTYTKIRVYKSTNGGKLVKVADLAASKHSFSDGGIATNSRYRYLIRVYNADGHADGTSNYCYTVPASPSGLSGYRTEIDNVSGVQLNWTDNSRYDDAMVLEKYDSESGEWFGEYLDAGTVSYFDTNPGNGELKYRVYAEADGEGSSYSNVFIVPALAAPAAPTVLLPSDNAACDRYGEVAFRFVHNSLDTSPMTGFKIEYADNAAMTGATVEQGSITGTVYEYTKYIELYDYPADTVYFRIATCGMSGTYGQYSPVQSFILITPPTLELVIEPGQDTIEYLPVSLQFVYTDTQQFGLKEINVSTVDSEGEQVADGKLHLEYAGQGSYGGTLTLDGFMPADGASYTTYVEAVSTSGLSASEGFSYTISFTPPNIPVITVEQVAGCGVQIFVDEGNGGSNVPTWAIDVSRIVNGEASVIYSELSPGTTVIDHIPCLDSAITYRATAYATQRTSYASNDASITVDSDGCVFINYGDGFQSYKALQMDLQWSIATSNKRGLYQVRGRQDPVVRTTPYRERKLSASGTIRWVEENFLELQDIPGTVYLREPHGRCVPCVMDVSTTYVKGQPLVTVDLSFTQVSDG